MASDWSSPATRGLMAAGVVGLVVLLVFWFDWWARPPQMDADEEVFATVDALFTAVTARDQKLLADCERRLLALKDAGKLPLEASAYLDKVISKARAGRWQKAAETLYDFMRAQRRDGAQDHPIKNKVSVKGRSASNEPKEPRAGR